MGFLNAWWALSALLAGPIVLLYLLKMRRRPVTISSTLLWRQVLADMRANSPFQKLRRNLLLILQLLALALLVLAMTQPIIKAAGLAGGESVIVLDASASMQTADAAGDRTRFQEAVRQAERLIDSMSPGDRTMLIVTGLGGTGVRTPLTASKAELRSALRRAEACDVPLEVTDALRLAAATLGGEGAGRLRGPVYLFSDGVGVTLPETPGLADALRYVRMGQTDLNVGVTAVNVEADTAGQQTVTVAVANAGPVAVEVTVNFSFAEPDNWIDAQLLTIPAGGQSAVELNKTLPPGRLWVQLNHEPDALALDNTAYVLLPEPRQLQVELVTAGNPPLQHFLAVAEANGFLQARRTAPAQYAVDPDIDVTIFDLVAPDDLPPGEVVLIRPPREVAGFRPAGQVARPEIINVRNEADVLRDVNLADFAVAEAGRYEHDGAAMELVQSQAGPLIAYTEQGLSRRYLLAFHLADSTWSTDVGLLVFLSNLLDRARQAHFVGMAQLLTTGSTAQLPAGADQGRVGTPDGSAETIPAGINAFSGVDRVGFYRVERGPVQREFAANLLSNQETNIAPRDLLAPTGVAIEGRTSVHRTNRPLWPILALVAASVLLIEWYCYHRRVN